MISDEAKKCLKLIAKTYNLAVKCYRYSAGTEDSWVGFRESKRWKSPFYYCASLVQKNWPNDKKLKFGERSLALFDDVYDAIHMAVPVRCTSNMEARSFDEACVDFAKYLSGKELFGYDLKKCLNASAEEARNLPDESFRTSICILPVFSSYEELKLKLALKKL